MGDLMAKLQCVHDEDLDTCSRCSDHAERKVPNGDQPGMTQRRAEDDGGDD
jgi:hypothetical protein